MKMTKDFVPSSIGDERFDEIEGAVPRKSCNTCSLKPNCSIRARALAIEMVSGLSLAGGQRLQLPTMDSMPMPCGGDAWQPITARRRVVRLFEDWNPNPTESRDEIPYGQTGFTVNEQGLPE